MMLAWNTSSLVLTAGNRFRWCWICLSITRLMWKTAKCAANPSRFTMLLKMMTSPILTHECCSGQGIGRGLHRFNLRVALLSFALVLLANVEAFATWSIVAVDKGSGQIVVASAT